MDSLQNFELKTYFYFIFRNLFEFLFLNLNLNLIWFMVQSVIAFRSMVQLVEPSQPGSWLGSDFSSLSPFSLSIPRSRPWPDPLSPRRRRPTPACSNHLRRRATVHSEALLTLFHLLRVDLLFPAWCGHARLNPRVRVSVSAWLRRSPASRPEVICRGLA